VHIAVRERVGHLHADVAATHDGRLAHRPGGQVLVDAQAVVHGVQDVHAGQVQARHGRADWLGPGRHHQTVVGQAAPASLLVIYLYLVAVRVDRRRDMVQALLGHATIDTVLVYAKLYPTTLMIAFPARCKGRWRSLPR
jgi:hypothetical protein